MTTPQERQQIQSHAGLRGAAAILVVIYHLQFGEFRLPIEDCTFFFKRSYLFVDLFFMLSGFIISLTNERCFSTHVDSSEYRQFLAKRIARLYPLLFFTLLYLVIGRHLLVAAYHQAGRPGPRFDDSLAILLAQATLANAWLPNPEGWNLPSWSISAEMFSYLLFPFLSTLSRRRPQIGQGLLLLLALGYYVPIAFTTESLDVIGGTAPFRCLAGFATGMLVYQHRARFLLPRPTLAALQMLAAGSIVLLLSFRTNDVLIIPFFILLVGTTWQDRGPVGAVLSTRAPVWLGTISYSIYLNHVPVIQLVGAPYGSVERMLKLDPVNGRIIWIIVCLGSILLLSIATYRWVEVPGRRWLGRLLVHGRLSPIGESPPAP